MARWRRWGRGGGVIAAIVVAAGTAGAQAPAPVEEAPLGAGMPPAAATPPAAETPAQPLGPTLTSPYDISLCLCLQRDIAKRQATLNERRGAYDQLAGEIRDAQTAVARDRPRVDVNDPAAVARFKMRLDELDAMSARQAQVVLPAYQAAVGTYNQRVAQFTERCSGRVYDPGVTAQVRNNLICRLDD